MTNTTQVQTKTITIVLTGRRPVRIDPDHWPLVASAEDCDDRAIPFQANRRWGIKVRQHSCGKAVVYGYFDADFTDERYRRGGEMVLDPEQIPAAIARVVDQMDEATPAHVDFGPLADECIGDLPPVELDAA